MQSPRCSNWPNVKGIHGSELKRLPVPVPPLFEQRAIAAALGDVDGLIGALDRLIAKKRDLKQAATAATPHGPDAAAWVLWRVGSRFGE